MKAFSVTTNVECSHIALHGWQSVGRALRHYAGLPSGTSGCLQSVASEQHEQGQAIEEDLGFDAALMFSTASAVVASEGLGESIVNEILADSRAALGGRGNIGRRWDRNYDWGGLGTVFFKTPIEIVRGGDNWFGFRFISGGSIYALAEELGANMSIEKATLRIRLEPTEGKMFRINFDPVARALVASGYASRGLKGKSIARAFHWENKFFAEPIRIWNGRGLQITMALESVGERREWVERRWWFDGFRSLWNLDRGKLAGPQLMNEDGTPCRPELTLTIKRAGGYRASMVPLLEPDLKGRALQIQQDLLDAFV